MITNRLLTITRSRRAQILSLRMDKWSSCCSNGLWLVYKPKFVAVILTIILIFYNFVLPILNKILIDQNQQSHLIHNQNFNLNINNELNKESICKLDDYIKEFIRRNVVWAPTSAHIDAINSFDEYPNPPIFDDETKMLYCPIPKNAHTQFRALFCLKSLEYVEDYGQIDWLLKDLMNAHRTIPLCRVESYSKFNVRNYEGKFNFTFTDPSWYKLMVTRDPFDRFVSGYLFMCGPTPYYGTSPTPAVGKWVLGETCLGCEYGDMHCFISKMLGKMLQLYRTQSVRPNTNRDYYFTWLIQLFQPQTWFCHLGAYSDQFNLISYDELSSNPQAIRDVFLARGWNESIINRGWGEDRSLAFLEQPQPNPSIDSEKHHFRTVLRNDMKLIDSIFKIYVADFVLLDLKFPEWLVKTCKSPAFQDKYKSFTCHWIRQTTGSGEGGECRRRLNSEIRLLKMQPV